MFISWKLSISIWKKFQRNDYLSPNGLTCLLLWLYTLPSFLLLWSLAPIYGQPSTCELDSSSFHLLRVIKFSNLSVPLLHQFFSCCITLIINTNILFRSVAQSYLTLYDTIYYSVPGLPVHHQLPELTQIHVHWVSDSFQPSHPLSSPSLSVFNLSQHQGLFQWVSSLHQVAKVLAFQLQHQSFQWIFRTYFL